MFFRFISFLLLSLLITPVECAVSPPKKLERFTKILKAQTQKLQGGAIAILYKGQVVYKTTFGYQRGKVGPITEHTLFPLASVSKALSAIALALWVDERRLDLNKPFALSYLKLPVTFKNILGHTTGYQFPGNSQIEQGMARPQILEKLQRLSPTCKPGECYSYSNTTFSLLEEALVAQQLSFRAAMEKMRTLLKTDGIQILPLPPSMPVAFPHALSKSKKGFKPLPFPPYYPKVMCSSAGVFASLEGMIQFFKLSFGYRSDLISSQTLAQFFEPLILNQDLKKWRIRLPRPLEDIESYYGLGWRRLKSKQKPETDLLFHSGYIGGIVSFIGYIPSEETGIIILINQESKFASEKGLEFWGEFLK